MELSEKIKNHFLQFVLNAVEASLLDEVRATPKPGLVDLHDSGAHRDMDYHTFIASAEAIAPFIAEMAGMGLSWKASWDQEALFCSLRPTGIEAEKAMFQATDGVNTHKGMIFSMGLAAAAAGQVFASAPDSGLTAQQILTLCREMCSAPLENDFASIDPENPKTHGERLYIQHGTRGIRGEAALGFPSILDISLPALRETISEYGSTDYNALCIHVLLKLMSKVDDTNVLFRTDYESLLYVKNQAGRILTLGGGFTEEGMTELRLLNEKFIKRNISPGGCADLLAITLFLWRLEQFSISSPQSPKDFLQLDI